jgi:hypothetical protein
LEAGGGRQREKSDGRPAQEIGEDQQGHPFGNPRVVRIPRLRASNSAVHLKAIRRAEVGEKTSVRISIIIIIGGDVASYTFK